MLGLRNFARFVALTGSLLLPGGCFLFTTQYDSDDGAGQEDTDDGTTDDDPPPEADETSGDEPEPPPGATCPSRSAPTVGLNERAQLRHAWGTFACLFGCGAEQPLAADAISELIVLDAASLGEFEVASDDPDVATFSHTSGTVIDVETGRAGSVQLELLDPATGELLEAFQLEVKDIAEIDASYGWDSRLTIAVGGAVRIPVNFLDADGCDLVGVGAVDYKIGGGFDEYSLSLYDLFTDLLVGLLFGGNLQETFELEAHELGEGVVVISASSGASFDLPVASVDASAVATIDAPEQVEVSPGSTIIFGVDAYDTDGERVYAPDCDWSVDPEGSASIGDLRHEVAISSDTPGVLTVTCTVGAAASQTIVRIE